MNAPVFTTAAPTVAPDPSKHVHYTQGMVLGVDDFTQEFAYLDHRDQWHAREAIGYGTITGLHVVSHLKDGGHEITVSPGVAISPRGQLIQVTTAQCASIEAWLQLATTKTQLAERGIAAGSAFNAYVVLCYRDCSVDELPVPGEPCRCDSETMAPSRIQDDFRLELTFQPPPQKEEDAVRALVGWLRSLPVDDAAPSAGELEAFLEALRTEFQSLLSPPAADLASPPASPPANLRIPRGHLCRWMRAALRLWVTELRPDWQEQWRARATACGCGCGGASGCHGTGDPLPEQGRECLLLARVSVTRAGATVTAAALDEDDRPFLVHLRMLQELILCGGREVDLGVGARTFATVFAIDDHTLRLWLHFPETVTVPEDGASLWLGGVEQENFSLSLLQPNLYDLVLPGSPPGLLAGGTTIELRLDVHHLQTAAGQNLAAAFAGGWYRFNDYEEPILRVFGHVDTSAADPLAAHLADPGAHMNHQVQGDVEGTLASTQVARLQGKLLQAPNPLSGQFLQFSQPNATQPGRWQPATLSVPLGNSVDTDIVAENVLGTAATDPDAGTSAKFARADHTHGVPANPIPPHVADVTAHLAHQIRGDITQTIGATFVSALQGVTLDAPSPLADQVLQFDKPRKAWLAKTITAGGTADAVLHPPGLRTYFIVAAGMLRRDPAAFTHSYNDLRLAVPPATGATSFILTFGPAAPQGDPAVGYVAPKTKHMYVVKGTSCGKIPCLFHVEKFDDSGIVVRLVNVTDQTLFERVMIEVSLFFNS